MIIKFSKGGLTAFITLSREQEQAAAKAETAAQLYFSINGLQQAKVRNLLHITANDETGHRKTAAELLQDVTAVIESD